MSRELDKKPFFRSVQQKRKKYENSNGQWGTICQKEGCAYIQLGHTQTHDSKITFQNKITSSLGA